MNGLRLACRSLITIGACLLASSSAASPPRKAEEPTKVAESSLLQISREMRVWLDLHVQRVSDARGRAQRLFAALVDFNGLGLEQVLDHTPTAAEAFRSRRANCVGFALLYVALAQELGLPAGFLLSDRAEASRRAGALAVEDRHLAAALAIDGGLWLVDFGGLQRAPGSAQTVDLSTVTALFLSNRGTELLLAARPREALLVLRCAVGAQAETPWVWVNLGLAYRSLGNRESAEAAFRHALTLEPNLMPAWRNLALLLGEGRQSAIDRSSSPPPARTVRTSGTMFF